MPAPLEHLQLQIDTLFVRDAAGRLARLNETSNVNTVPPAPRVFFGRTAAGNAWSVRADLPNALCRRIEHLLAAEPVGMSLKAPPRCRRLLYELLGEIEPVQEEWSGPAFAFPDRLSAPAGVVPVTAANGDLLAMHFPDVLADLSTSRPCIAAIENGEAVSVCFSARNTPRAAEAGVHTAPPFRGRGYASAVTVAWALAIRERGAIPLYSTSWENLASRAVARRLGLILYGSDWELS
jgi:hypothetical protein